MRRGPNDLLDTQMLPTADCKATNCVRADRSRLKKHAGRKLHVAQAKLAAPFRSDLKTSLTTIILEVAQAAGSIFVPTYAVTGEN